MLHLVRSMLPKGEALGSLPSWREVDRMTNYARVYRSGNRPADVIEAVSSRADDRHTGMLCGRPLAGVDRFPNLMRGPEGRVTRENLHCCRRA